MKANTDTRSTYRMSTWMVIPAVLIGLLGCGINKNKMLGASMNTQHLQSASSHVSVPAFPVSYASLPGGGPALIDAGTIIMVNGTYTGCAYQGTTPSSLGKWTVATNGYSAPTLDYDPLEVVQGDPTCTLTITDVEMQFGVNIYNYKAQSAMPLTGSYLNNAIAFEDPANPGPIIFYANVIQDAGGSTYTAPIHAIFAYSSDLNSVPGTYQTTYAMQSAIIDTVKIGAPNYTFNSAASTLQIKVDFSKVIQSITGNLEFTNGSVLGDDYVIVSSLSSVTNPEIVQNAFLSGTPTVILSTLSIPGSSLLFTTGVSSVAASPHRYIIIRHKDPAEAASAIPVSSYEVFDITFSPPL